MRMEKRGICICGLVEHPVGVLSFTNILQSTRYLFNLMTIFQLQIARKKSNFFLQIAILCKTQFIHLNLLEYKISPLQTCGFFCLVNISNVLSMKYSNNHTKQYLRKKNRVPRHQLLQPSYFFKFLFLTSVVCIKCYECLTSTQFP